MLDQVPLHSRVRRFSAWGLPGYIALALTVILLLAVLDVRNDADEVRQTDQDIARVAAETKIAECLNFNLLLIEVTETRRLVRALAQGAIDNSENQPFIEAFRQLLADFNDTAKQNCLRKLLEVEAELGLKIESLRPLTVRP